MLPREIWFVGALVLVPFELAVPLVAERAGTTPWNRHHIAERYGLLTLIVLGESVLSATLAIQSALDLGELTAPLGGLIAGGLLILFAMWWLYFDVPAHRYLESNREGFLWGYGHLFIFGATAAVAALSIAAAFTPAPVPVIGVVLAGLVAWTLVATRPAHRAGH